MASRVLVNVADTAYKIFIFNPETVRCAKEFMAGHYEWSWILLMMAAVLILNVKFWTFFRYDRDKLPRNLLQAAAEGIVHWCLSNAVLYLALELNRLIYDAFTDYIPAKFPVGSPGKTGTGFSSLLTKMTFMNDRTVLVPRVRNPYVPFALMLTTSLIMFCVAYVVKNERIPTVAAA